MAYTPSQQAILHEVFGLINRWIKESENSDTPILEYRDPQSLIRELDLKINTEGSGDAALLEEVRKYLKYSVRTAHPAYLNQLFGGFNFPGFIGEIITSLTNTSMYTYEVAPAATLMEIALIDKMVSYTGWGSGTGSLLTGGSNTNMVAMLLARNSIFKGSKYTGISGLQKPAILVSERSHFSMLKGANTIGIGQEGVIKVRIDENGRMRGPEVEAAILETLGKGMVPFMICSTLGTTETGSFDAIDEISPIAKKYKLWHHVDGSWGGSIILSEKRQSMFKGLEEADSFSWNPHKLMNIPLICSALLVRDNNVMREEIQSYDADYIYHDTEDGAYDLGPASLQCGRRVDSLKLWLAWKYYGDQGYANRIEKLFDLATFATERVKNSAHLELMFPTQTLNVNFRYKVPAGVDADAFNEKVRYRLIHEGKAMVNYCKLDNGLSIRLILLNPDLEEADLTRFFYQFETAAAALLSEMVVKS
jgi:glutamate/tyrosine decarboxylase-like PLP-dependent enzyme